VQPKALAVGFYALKSARRQIEANPFSEESLALARLVLALQNRSDFNDRIAALSAPCSGRLTSNSSRRRST